MTMKRLLGTALLTLVLLAGCGDSTSDSASDPASQPASTTASDKPTEAVAPQTIAIVSQTAAGGEVDLNAVPVDDDAALQEFTAQFNRAGLAAKIATAVAGATVPEGYTVMGAVVSIGCDVPPDVSVEQGPDGWVLRPHKVPSPLQECFAPVTSVAIVAVPA
jgi:hypothetical protein